MRVSTHSRLLASNSYPVLSHSHMKEPSTFSQRAEPHTPERDTHSSSSVGSIVEVDRDQRDRDRERTHVIISIGHVLFTKSKVGCSDSMAPTDNILEQLVRSLFGLHLHQNQV